MVLSAAEDPLEKLKALTDLEIFRPAQGAALQRANTARSKIRSAVEHVFATQQHRMGLSIRTIVVDGTKAKIDLTNITFNVKRLLYWKPAPAPHIRRCQALQSTKKPRVNRKTPQGSWRPAKTPNFLSL